MGSIPEHEQDAVWEILELEFGLLGFVKKTGRTTQVRKCCRCKRISKEYYSTVHKIFNSPQGRNKSHNGTGAFCRNFLTQRDFYGIVEDKNVR